MALVRQQAAGVTVAATCRVLDLPRSTYYRRAEPTAAADTALRDAIQRVALEWPSYGYRRITAELKRRGQVVNRKRVLRLMREDNLLVLRKRRARPHDELGSPATSVSEPRAGVGHQQMRPIVGLGHHLHPASARVHLPRRHP